MSIDICFKAFWACKSRVLKQKLAGAFGNNRSYLIIAEFQAVFRYISCDAARSFLPVSSTSVAFLYVKYALTTTSTTRMPTISMLLIAFLLAV